MKTFLLTLLSLVIGYGIGVGAGFGLVHLLSSNRHDKSMEAAMTGFFVAGPIVALLSAGGMLAFRLLAK
jgi:hypothetical protein